MQTMNPERYNFSDLNAEESKPKKRRRWLIWLALLLLLGIASYFLVPILFPSFAESVNNSYQQFKCNLFGCETEQSIACDLAKESKWKEDIEAYFETYGEDPNDPCYESLITLLDSIECANIDNAKDRRKAYTDYLVRFGSNGSCYRDVEARLEALECAIVERADPEKNPCLQGALGDRDCGTILLCLDSIACDNLSKITNNRRAAMMSYINTFGALGICYPEVYASLDSMDCAAAQTAEDKKQAYYDYLDYFGEDGSCSEKFQSQIDDCAQAEGDNNCLAFTNYILKHGPNAICAEEFFDRISEMGCEKLFDFEKAKFTNNLADLRNYLEKYKADEGGSGEAGNYYDDIKRRLELAECENARDQDLCYLYGDYIKKYGKEGICYEEFITRISAKYNIRVEDVPDLDFDTFCDDRPTEASVIAKGFSDDEACNLARKLDNCNQYRAYVNQFPTGKCAAEFRSIIAARCPSNKSTACRTFKTRDGKTVEAIKLGPMWVMTNNLVAPDASKGSPSLFTWHEAQSACPEGWRLPCEQEVQFYQETYYSNPTNAFNSLSSLDQCDFSKNLYGPLYGQNLSNNFGNGIVAQFWLATEASDLAGYTFGLNRNDRVLFVNTNTNKDKRLPCRCVQETPDYNKSKISIIYKGCPNRPKPWLAN